MGQQRGGRSTSIATGKPLPSAMVGPMDFFGALTGKSSVGAIPRATPTPEISPTRPSLSGQQDLGINTTQTPFSGSVGTSPSAKRDPFDTKIDLPDTTVGLTPGSEDKEEEDTITAPTINDEEKRREAAEKANDWLS